VSQIDPVTWRTERMLLRAFRPTDIAEFARVAEASREAWKAWTPAHDPDLTERELFERELYRGMEGARLGTHLRLAGFADDGALVGMFSLNEIVRGAFHSAHAGWQVSADRMGRGFATEGVRGLVGVAFAAPPSGLGLHRVQANIMPSNVRSLRVAEKVGFRHEGHAERYLQIAGRWEDHVMLALTREEWPH